MADDPATVTVPRELLREVLENADNHAWGVAALIRLHGRDTLNDEADKARAKIYELRRLAGMEE